MSCNAVMKLFLISMSAEENTLITYHGLNHMNGVPSGYGSLKGSRDVFLKVLSVNSYVMSFVS